MSQRNDHWLLVISAVVILAILAALIWFAPKAESGARRCFRHNATIVGTNGPDVITGTDNKDWIVTRKGMDTVFAGPGNDRVCGGRGDDTLIGEPGWDRINGKKGDDRCVGEVTKKCEHGP